MTFKSKPLVLQSLEKLLVAFGINFICVTLQMLIPFFIREIINYITYDNPDENPTKGIYLVILIIISRILISITSAHSLNRIVGDNDIYG